MSKDDYEVERVTIRDKNGKVIRVFKKGTKGKVDELRDGRKTTGKRTFHRDGTTHEHGDYSRGGRKSTFSNNGKIYKKRPKKGSSPVGDILKGLIR